MKIKKNIKPIDIDVHLKYRCPKASCSSYHWLSLKEAKTKNFKVVCDCGFVFKPSTIKNIKIAYIAKKLKINDLKDTEHKDPPQDLINICSQLLIEYGFSKSEAKDLISQTYSKHQINDSKIIIKHIIQNIGATHNG